MADNTAVPKDRLEAEKLLRRLLTKPIDADDPDSIDLDRIIGILRVFKSIKLSKFQSLNLILHTVKLHLQPQFHFFIAYFCGKDGLIEKKLETQQSFIDYLNQIDAAGFSALSYAAYFEFEDLALRLIELGANHNYVNQDDDSIMVLAVKGGSLKVLMKLQELGVDLYQRKNGNLSLLHFACYEGNLHIIKYLLKMNELDGGMSLRISEPDINSGETPLHMAVQSGEYPVVKYLLINNANKTARCNNKRTPYDTALELKKSGQIPPQRINGIIGLLGEIPLRKRFQLQTRVGPTTRFNTYSSITLAINAFGFIGQLLIIPYAGQAIILGSIFVFLSILSVSTLILNRMDPGYIQPYGHQNFSNENVATSKKETFIQNFTNLLRYKEYENLCIECCIVKPLRSKHCDFCRRCVSVIDHHCPFVGNCIGSKNHKYFFLMLVTQMLSQLFNLLLCILFYIRDSSDKSSDSISSYLIDKCGIIFVREYAIGFTAILFAQFLITVFPLFFMLQHQITVITHAMTSLELRFKSKHHFDKQQAQEFDDVVPVTDLPERTKSKQFVTAAAAAADNSSFRTDVNSHHDSTLSQSFNPNAVELPTFHSTQSKQQEINYKQFKANSKWKNIIELLFKNARNPLYFASEKLHRMIFTGQDPNGLLLDSSFSSDQSNHGSLTESIDLSNLIK